jgi:hypothetical protein
MSIASGSKARDDSSSVRLPSKVNRIMHVNGLATLLGRGTPCMTAFQGRRIRT